MFTTYENDLTMESFMLKSKNDDVLMFKNPLREIWETAEGAPHRIWNRRIRQKIPPGAPRIRTTYKLGVATAHCLFHQSRAHKVPPTTVLCRFFPIPDTLKKFPRSPGCLILLDCDVESPIRKWPESSTRATLPPTSEATHIELVVFLGGS